MATEEAINQNNLPIVDQILLPATSSPPNLPNSLPNLPIPPPNLPLTPEQSTNLPTKHLKCWLSDFAVTLDDRSFFKINIKYGAVLSPPDNNMHNIYAGWSATKFNLPLNSKRYTAYAINCYNIYLDAIFDQLTVKIKTKNIPKLNYLLTNLDIYLQKSYTWCDVQTVIWKLLNKKQKQYQHIHVAFNQTHVDHIWADVEKYGHTFIPRADTDLVTVFILITNTWPNTTLQLINQVVILPLKLEQFHPPDCLAEWGNYPPTNCFSLELLL